MVGWAFECAWQLLFLLESPRRHVGVPSHDPRRLRRLRPDAAAPLQVRRINFMVWSKEDVPVRCFGWFCADSCEHAAVPLSQLATVV